MQCSSSGCAGKRHGHADLATDRSARIEPLRSLDVSDPELFRTGRHWDLLARLRREAPVHYTETSPYGPYWSVTRHEDIAYVEKHHEVYSSQGNVIIGDVPPEFDCTRAFATFDPPEHTRDRKPVVPCVSPPRLTELEAGTRATIAAILDGLPRNQVFDWGRRVSYEMTTRMAAVLFDFPESEREQLNFWYQVLVTTPAPDGLVTSWEARDAVLAEYRERLLGMWNERTAKSGADIISALAQDPGTARMIEDPMWLVGTVSLIAGANEAAQAALSGCIVAFDQYPAQWDKLRDEPALIANAVDEIVRWQSPITHMRRTATEDTVLGSANIRAGDRVVLWYCSANRDEGLFDDGNSLRIDRHNARRHLAYGFGIHRCLGHHVAKLQLRLLLEEMLARFERVEIVGQAERLASNFSSNYRKVPVRLTG